MVTQRISHSEAKLLSTLRNSFAEISRTEQNNDLLPRLQISNEKNRILIVCFRGKYTAYQVFTT